MKTSKPSTRICAFFFVTFAWSWTCWLVSAVIKLQSIALATTLMFAGSLGPSLAAVLVVADASGRAGLRAWLGRCLRRPPGWTPGWTHGWGWMALRLLAQRNVAVPREIPAR